jgi:hypothetical protein
LRRLELTAKERREEKKVFSERNYIYYYRGKERGTFDRKCMLMKFLRDGPLVLLVK